MMVRPIGIALIPAYQPSRLLLELLKEVRAAGMTALVIDDGSGSKSHSIFLAAKEYATVLTHERNLGKGRRSKPGYPI